MERVESLSIQVDLQAVIARLTARIGADAATIATLQAALDQAHSGDAPGQIVEEQQPPTG